MKPTYKELEQQIKDTYMKGYRDALGNRQWWIDEHKKQEQQIKELKECLSHVMKVASFEFNGKDDYLDMGRIKQALK